ncbi:MAG: hypothetical protein HGA94_03710, partial [Candidatus Aminicenantes bacterium]|nr:hypothetical protein [Candidatus Aminicenantes bacterium]
MNAGAAFLLFHLRVGARLALRILAPVLAAILFLFYILRPEFMLALARALFIEGSLAESGVAGTLLLLGIARAVTPRISAGRAGWARSLPAKGRVLRALEILSSIVGEAPLLAVLGVLAWAVARPDRVRVALLLAGLLVGAAAAIGAAQPVTMVTQSVKTKTSIFLNILISSKQIFRTLK